MQAVAGGMPNPAELTSVFCGLLGDSTPFGWLQGILSASILDTECTIIHN
jgi:hypothetical protein